MVKHIAGRRSALVDGDGVRLLSLRLEGGGLGLPRRHRERLLPADDGVPDAGRSEPDGVVALLVPSGHHGRRRVVLQSHVGIPDAVVRAVLALCPEGARLSTRAGARTAVLRGRILASQRGLCHRELSAEWFLSFLSAVDQLRHRWRPDDEPLRGAGRRMDLDLAVAVSADGGHPGRFDQPGPFQLAPGRFPRPHGVGALCEPAVLCGCADGLGARGAAAAADFLLRQLPAGTDLPLSGCGRVSDLREARNEDVLPVSGGGDCGGFVGVVGPGPARHGCG